MNKTRKRVWMIWRQQESRMRNAISAHTPDASLWYVDRVVRRMTRQAMRSGHRIVGNRHTWRMVLKSNREEPA